MQDLIDKTFIDKLSQLAEKCKEPDADTNKILQEYNSAVTTFLNTLSK